ncbi:N-acetylglucosamine-6-phosphate deacetylase [Stieleria sp. JC731]|uniref:N-acetylglucosamine-6-phosphate deacetylase n=1 Tax=Pirellulaceae TaxID=2691357 RepID=UPI001E3E9C45|nr:N-acetylglucosamine-6-phosphate deacetylase [Stieleria sp. JC731]MCC9600134.1 N-acetylglucosamine-6-phosphate deacetylase [Stieleria sp. JC731]
MNGFIDLQVNGYAGVDFNSDDLAIEDIAAVCDKLKTVGTAVFLPTIITADLDAMQSRIAKIADAIESDPSVAAMMGGIHVEGPFISCEAGYIGAHPADAACDATEDAISRLLDAGRGYIRLVTLAPEVAGAVSATKRLADQGITVAGGHSNATLDQLHAAIDAGMTMFTHLGNGCPVTMHRHDNIINRVLACADQLRISFIADGHHVPWFAMRNYMNNIPDQNIIIVTDAISAAGLGPGKHRLADQWVEVDPSLAAWGEGRKQFAGCATEMPRMVTMLMEQKIASEDQIKRWTVDNPARVLGIPV